MMSDFSTLHIQKLNDKALIEDSSSKISKNGKE